MKIKIRLVAIILFCSLPFAVASSADELGDEHALAINSDEIYSITVTPNKTYGATRYTLKIYSYEDHERPAVELTRPLRGGIANVDIVDIDKDGKEELVIDTTYNSSSAKFNRDIFELGANPFFNMIKEYFLKG